MADPCAPLRRRPRLFSSARVLLWAGGTSFITATTVAPNPTLQGPASDMVLQGQADDHTQGDTRRTSCRSVLPSPSDIMTCSTLCLWPEPASPVTHIHIPFEIMTDDRRVIVIGSGPSGTMAALALL